MNSLPTCIKGHEEKVTSKELAIAVGTDRGMNLT